MIDQDPNSDELFWHPAGKIYDPPVLPPETPSVLERLGPTPFAKSGFPFLGFLATVYDHVAGHCQPEPGPQQVTGENGG
ncbi:MAG: hypothetical protein JWN40_3353 [Phycisphaerales bacterium]|nr:hypothetical protein [Phycisphaerales bacterium]